MKWKLLIFKEKPYQIPFRNLTLKTLGTFYSNLVKRKPPDPPYKHIIQIGDPILRTPSDEVPVNLIKSKEIQFLINHMKSVLKKYKCVGLSATQIGVPLRIIMFEFNKTHANYYSKNEFHNKEMSLSPLKVIINPEMKIVDYKKLIFPEACESVKGFKADVPRYRTLVVQGQDENGNHFTENMNGWLARIIQHEMDHLDGKIYTDIMDRKTLTCTCWNIVNEHSGKVELPYGPT